MRPYLYAAGSVLLVSSAQLLMKAGMDHLPQGAVSDLLAAALARPGALLAVAGGLAAYATSLALWMFSLEGLPLGRAYSLLALSYVLVHLGGLVLPGFDEPFRAQRLAGILLVVGGVALIHRRR